MTLADSNVLLDIIVDDEQWGAWSEAQLGAALRRGPLCINAIVYAEIASSFATVAELDVFVAAGRLTMREMSRAMLHRAGLARRRYRDNGGEKPRMLPDFLIGAHAELEGLKLITRDPKPYRTYFPDVTLIAP